MRRQVWLAGAWTAVLWFFTFGVARTLFAVFPRERAGEVTTALFPAYFAVVLTLGLLSLATLWPHRRAALRCRTALVLQALALLALACIPLVVQPALLAHPPGSPGFARWHGISMSLNLFSLLTVPASSLFLASYFRRERNDDG